MLSQTRGGPSWACAETSYELRPDGVRCTITLPISTQPRKPAGD